MFANVLVKWLIHCKHFGCCSSRLQRSVVPHVVGGTVKVKLAYKAAPGEVSGGAGGD